MSTAAQPQPRDTAAPTIRLISPISASPGETVTVLGNDFGDTPGTGYLQFWDNEVSWGAPGNSAHLNIASWSGGEIGFVVPMKDASGFQTTPGTTARINVTNSSGLTSNTAFIPITAAAPVIASLTPSTAAPGDTIVIEGQNFGAERGTGYVHFADENVSWGAPGNVAQFTVVSWSDTKISFQVPMKDANGYQTMPGTAATVTVTSQYGVTSNSEVLNLKTVAPPSIQSISPISAAAGAPIVVNGKNFGTSAGQAGYLHFADDNTNWGAPGNLAHFQILNWSDTQIKFLVPMKDSGGNQVIPGTMASITVTNGNGLTSNTESMMITTAVTWPVTADSGITKIGTTGSGTMHTTVVISEGGSLDAATTIQDTSAAGIFTGFHGASVVAIFDMNGNKLGTFQAGPWGVEGGQTQNVNWTGRLSIDERAAIFSIAVVNFYDPKFQDSTAIPDWILAHESEIAAAAIVIATIAG